MKNSPQNHHHRTTMPTNKPDELPSSPNIASIEAYFDSIIPICEEFDSKHPGNGNKLVALLHKFHSNLTSKLPHLQPTLPNPKPNSLSDEIKGMKEDIHTLQKSLLRLQNPTTSPPPDLPSNPISNSTTSPTTPSTPSDENSTSPPPRPSIVVHLAQFELTSRFDPQYICAMVNKFLVRSSHSKVHISAAKWTTRGNVTLTGGADNSLDQILAAKSIITKGILARFPSLSTQTPPPITANTKWSKILINNIPTGTSSTRGPWTTEECHNALCSENPIYAALNVTQKPSWVKPPNMYKADSTSSLVVAFEDPDGKLAQDIISARSLFAFGTCAPVRSWKEYPKSVPHGPHHDPTTHAHTQHSLL